MIRFNRIEKLFFVGMGSLGIIYKDFCRNEKP